MNDNTFESNSLADTEKAGSSIASQLIFPACVYLNGKMGAGKTTLTKSMVAFIFDLSAVTKLLVEPHAIANTTVSITNTTFLI